MKKRLLSILLAICMVMAFLPTTAMASGEISSPGGGWYPGDPKKDDVITAFKELEENVKNQSVPYGTPLQALKWPTRLQVMGFPAVNASVYDVTWAYETYDPNTPGTYVFTARCDPEKFTFAEGVEMPTITVTVNEPVPPEEYDDIDTWGALKKAVEDESSSEKIITITADLTADQPITIPVGKKVVLQTTGDPSTVRTVNVQTKGQLFTVKGTLEVQNLLFQGQKTEPYSNNLISVSGVLKMAGVTIQYYGAPTDSDTTKSGGAVISGSNNCAIELTDCTIQNNVSGEGTIVCKKGDLRIQDCEIRNNITESSSGSGGGVFASDSEIAITGSTIQGNGIRETTYNRTVYGGGIRLSECTGTIQGTTITGNYAMSGAGLFLEDSTLTIWKCEITENMGTRGDKNNITWYQGGGIYLGSCDLTITETEIKNNESRYWGGGLYICGSEGLSLDDTVQIVGNQATFGGGIFIDIDNDENAAVTLCGAEIKTNKAISKTDYSSRAVNGNGGGIYVNEGKLLLSGGAVTENSATGGEGGGVFVNAGTFTMTGGAISSNKAQIAGGVENAATFNMTGGTISDNDAEGTKADKTGVGGGVANTGIFTMSGDAEIYGNTADMAANDFYNGQAQSSGGGIDIGIDDSWGGKHDMELDSLIVPASAPRAAGGTFTLRSAEAFGYSGWFEDELEHRYSAASPTQKYTVQQGDTSRQYLTLGAPLPSITVKPENQTIYSGGKDGDGNNSEFPHPIYLVKNADGSFSELSGVTFQVNGTTWSGTGYPFTVKYYDADTNQEITDDQHYGDFTAKIVPVEGVEATDITTSDGRMVNFEEGTLRIRYVSSFTEAAKNTLTTDALEYTQETEETVKKQAESTGEAAVLLREDTKICLNGRSVYEYPVDASCQIALLFDELLPTRQGGDNQAYVDQLTAHAKEKGFDLTGKETLFRYLDLVDANDSNAWVSSSEGSDVFWPYPGGTDRSTDFQLLHFEGLHREYSMDGAGSLSAQIEASRVVAITDFEKTDAGIWFHVVDSGFSPFALVWEKSGVTPPEGTVTVTFRVVNGTWSDGTNVDRTYTISEGTSLTGSGISVPAGMRPNSGYEGGSWDVTPNPALPLSSNVTYTYSFARSHVGGGGGDDGGKEYILKFDSNGGTEFDQIEEEHTFTVNPYEDSHYGDHIPVRTGYIFTGWYHDSGLTRRIDGDITVSGVKTIFAGWRETSVPAMLNGDDHYAYVIGFSDGSVCPYANITRAQVATIFFRLLTEDVRREYLTTANTFPDVNGDYWANTAISTMARLGVIHGRNSGLFDPNAPITRAEFAAICSRFDHSEVTAQSGLTDIAGHWAEEEIERAVALGWVQGFGDNTFRPNENITRAQAVTMINRVLNRLPETPADLLPGMNTWTDCHEGDWYYLAMQEATNSHDYQRKDTVYECWTCLNADPDWKQYE